MGEGVWAWGEVGYHVSRSLLALLPAHLCCVCWQECDTFRSRWTVCEKEGRERDGGEGEGWWGGRGKEGRERDGGEGEGWW